MQRVTVKIKAELGKALSEKENVDERLRKAFEKVQRKEEQLNQLIGVPMDHVAKRETAEETRQKKIDELTEELDESEARAASLQEELYQLREKMLDLKFENETHHLKYARLQKRITELEQYKMHSSAISANLKN